MLQLRRSRACSRELCISLCVCFQEVIQPLSLSIRRGHARVVSRKGEVSIRLACCCGPYSRCHARTQSVTILVFQLYILIIPMCSPSVSSITPYTPTSSSDLAISLLALPLSCIVRLVEFPAIAGGSWIRVIPACKALQSLYYQLSYDQ